MDGRRNMASMLGQELEFMPTTVADSQSGECRVSGIVRLRVAGPAVLALVFCRSVRARTLTAVNGRVVQWTVICVDDRSRESERDTVVSDMMILAQPAALRAFTGLL